MRPEGIEPPAYRFEACRSIHLSYGRTTCNSTMLESKFASAFFEPASFLDSQRGPVAQLAEQQTLNLRVDGSIPSRLTT